MVAANDVLHEPGRRALGQLVHHLPLSAHTAATRVSSTLAGWAKRTAKADRHGRARKCRGEHKAHTHTDTDTHTKHARTHTDTDTNQDESDVGEPFISVADVREANVCQENLLHDKRGDGLGELCAVLHDAQTQRDHLCRKQELDHLLIVRLKCVCGGGGRGVWREREREGKGK